jgi:hypothetical protein
MPEESPSPRVSPSPSAYRKENPYTPPPPEYKPPSLLVEHRGLAIFFAAASIAFAVYCLKGPARPRDIARAPIAAAAAGTPDRTQAQSPPATAPAQPIYIEAIPEKDAR